MKSVLLLVCLTFVGCTKTSHPAEYDKVDPSTAAKLRGTVRFDGPRPAAKPISMNAEEGCEKLHDTPVDGSGFVMGSNGGLGNVFVYIKAGLEGKKFEPP